MSKVSSYYLASKLRNRKTSNQRGFFLSRKRGNHNNNCNRCDDCDDYPCNMESSCDCNDNNIDSDNLSKTSLNDEDSDDQLKMEILNKIKEQDIDKIKELVVVYVVLTHKENHKSYEGFYLLIEDNYISRYTGTGYEKVKGLRTFLESQLLEIEIDLTKIAIANKT